MRMVTQKTIIPWWPLRSFIKTAFFRFKAYACIELRAAGHELAKRALPSLNVDVCKRSGCLTWQIVGHSTACICLVGKAGPELPAPAHPRGKNSLPLFSMGLTLHTKCRLCHTRARHMLPVAPPVAAKGLRAAQLLVQQQTGRALPRKPASLLGRSWRWSKPPLISLQARFECRSISQCMLQGLGPQQ